MPTYRNYSQVVELSKARKAGDFSDAPEGCYCQFLIEEIGDQLDPDNPVLCARCRFEDVGDRYVALTYSIRRTDKGYIPMVRSRVGGGDPELNLYDEFPDWEEALDYARERAKMQVYFFADGEHDIYLNDIWVDINLL